MNRGAFKTKKNQSEIGGGRRKREKSIQILDKAKKFVCLFKGYNFYKGKFFRKKTNILRAH